MAKPRTPKGRARETAHPAGRGVPGNGQGALRPPPRQPVPAAGGHHPVGPDHRRAGQPGHPGPVRPLPDGRPTWPPPTPARSRRSSGRPASSGPRRGASSAWPAALVDRFGGEVPVAIEDLVTPARRRPQDGQRGPQRRPRRARAAGRHPRAAGCSRLLGLTAETDPVKVELELDAMLPPRRVGSVQPAADPARTAGVHRPHAAVRGVRPGRLLPVVAAADHPPPALTRADKSRSGPTASGSPACMVRDRGDRSRHLLPRAVPGSAARSAPVDGARFPGAVGTSRSESARRAHRSGAVALDQPGAGGGGRCSGSARPRTARCSGSRSSGLGDLVGDAAHPAQQLLEGGGDGRQLGEGAHGRRAIGEDGMPRCLLHEVPPDAGVPSDASMPVQLQRLDLRGVHGDVGPRLPRPDVDRRRPGGRGARPSWPRSARAVTPPSGRCTERFDGVALDDLRVPAAEIDAALAGLRAACSARRWRRPGRRSSPTTGAQLQPDSRYERDGRGGQGAAPAGRPGRALRARRPGPVPVHGPDDGHPGPRRRCRRGGAVRPARPGRCRQRPDPRRRRPRRRRRGVPHRRGPGHRRHGLRHRDAPRRSTSSSAPATPTSPSPSARSPSRAGSACRRPSPGRPRWSWWPTPPRRSTSPPSTSSSRPSTAPTGWPG